MFSGKKSLTLQRNERLLKENWQEKKSQQDPQKAFASIW